MNALEVLEEYSQGILKGKTFTDKENSYTNCRLIFNQNYGANEFESTVYIELIKKGSGIRKFKSKNQIITLENGNTNLFQILKTFQGKIFKGKKFIDNKGKTYEKLSFVVDDVSSQHLFMIQHKRNKENAQILYKKDLLSLEEIIN